MKDEQENKVKEENTSFQAKFAQWLSPFQITFVIFWVICNYDFLLILIGKKAILHDLYNHFGYGCGVLNITDDGKIYTNYQLNLFVCVEKSRLAYAGYFAMWKVAIPLGLTWLHTHLVYPVVIAKINEKDRFNKENERGTKEWAMREEFFKELNTTWRSSVTATKEAIYETEKLQSIADKIKDDIATVMGEREKFDKFLEEELPQRTAEVFNASIAQIRKDIK